ncbi:hypothetical protein BKI52_16735 [marine bacterium AO1-C]|nr:hypothetical protein BKI52_16735 [marine bacterium AO1-C]
MQILKSTKKKLINRFPLYFLLGLILTFASCNDKIGDPTPTSIPNPNATKILPIGASRVEGARPTYESYRYELWKLLVDGKKNVDFIGSITDEASYPVYQSLSFDNNHEGRGGLTSGEILSSISHRLDEIVTANGIPEIVLFSSPGGNDGLQNLSYDDAVKNVNDIIDLLQAKNPNVTIIIEQMAPPSSNSTDALKNYLTRMNTEVVNIAAAQTTNASKVITVDMNTGFTDALLADQVHYNEAGAKFIAERYYAAIKDLVKQNQ